MPLWTDSLIGDTTHLSATEFGAYMRILVAMWRNRGWLPSDEKKLVKYSSLTAGQWRRSRDTLIAFLTFDGNRVTQRKLLKVWVAVERKGMKAKNSANARWLKERENADAVASNPQCERNANQNQNHYSEANASGAGAPERPLVDVIFGPGLRLLTSNGVPDRQARSMLGKWRGEYGDEALLTALGKAQREGAIDPVGFVTGCLKQAKRQKGKADDKLDRIKRLADRLDGRAEGDGPLDYREGDGPSQPLLSARAIGGD